MAMMIRDIVATLGYFGRRADDDIVDRLHYFVTTNTLLGLAILVSFKQFGGRPIECMVPDIFTGAWEQYTEQYCWSENTYFLPMAKREISQDRKERTHDKKISYYQWVPFFLLIEAACFSLPSYFWKLLSGRSGIKIHNLVESASDPGNVKPDVKKNTIKTLSCHVENALRFHRRLEKKHLMPHRYMRVMNLQYTACYVTSMYLATKALYLINVIVQWILLNRFLQTDKYAFYGLDIVRDLVSGSSWDQTGIFPRVTLCDFDVRMMGSNVQPYTIQCVLTINLFNEKIFVFLYFWYLVLLLLTAGSFIWWAVLMLLPWPSRWFITLHMELSEMPFDPKQSQRAIEIFVDKYLKKDGVFLLRMINMHTGVIFTTDMVLALWKKYYGIEEECQRQMSQAAGSDLRDGMGKISTASEPSNASSLKNAWGMVRRRFASNKGDDDRPLSTPGGKLDNHSNPDETPYWDKGPWQFGFGYQNSNKPSAPPVHNLPQEQRKLLQFKEPERPRGQQPPKDVALDMEGYLMPPKYKTDEDDEVHENDPSRRNTEL